jgi:hypothetical protein
MRQQRLTLTRETVASDVARANRNRPKSARDADTQTLGFVLPLKD